MKFIIVFVSLFALALAAPPRTSVPSRFSAPPHISAHPAHQSDSQILRYESDVQPEGYRFAVETSEGSIHNEEGQLKNIGTENEAIVVRGQFSFVADDGNTYTVNYIADENGFQPQGAHLPQVA